MPVARRDHIVLWPGRALEWNAAPLIVVVVTVSDMLRPFDWRTPNET
jgi:hypothetical protein